MALQVWKIETICKPLLHQEREVCLHDEPKLANMHLAFKLNCRHKIKSRHFCRNSKSRLFCRLKMCYNVIDDRDLLKCPKISEEMQRVKCNYGNLFNE